MLEDIGCHATLTRAATAVRSARMHGIVSKILLLAIPLVFVVLGFGLGSQQFHWDTLERAVLLEQPSSFWRSWDGSPRSQFLSFAHVLELPLASIVRVCTGMPHGITALVWFETPTNPLLDIFDISAIAEVAHARIACTPFTRIMYL